MIDKEKIIMYSSNFFTKMARIYEKSIGRAFVGMFNHGWHRSLENSAPTELDMMAEVYSREEFVNDMRFYSEKYSLK